MHHTLQNKTAGPRAKDLGPQASGLRPRVSEVVDVPPLRRLTYALAPYRISVLTYAIVTYPTPPEHSKWNTPLRPRSIADVSTSRSKT
eukprot:941578-Rhodomonas_salina.1